MTPHEQFWTNARDAARAAGHIWPEMAACEAALESAWGSSELARADNNLFGTKQHAHPVFGTHNLPTREWLHNGWVVVNAEWVKYPTLADCFADRMATLKRLAPSFPHYAAALAATSGTQFVIEVSKSWSTDPKRADKVLAIYTALVA